MTKKEKSAAMPRLRFPEFRVSNELHNTTIGDLSTDIAAGGTPDTSVRSYWNGELRWMNSGELNLKRVYEVQGRITEEGLRNSSTKVIPERSVLIGLAGQGRTRGTVAMNMVPLCINQSIAAIPPNAAKFDSDFLYHNLDNRYEELRRLSAGGEGRGGLNLQIIRNLKIFLPALPEQKKIGACLTSLDEVIAAHSQKLKALRAHKQGLVQQLFPREGEAVPRRRFPQFRNGPNWKIVPLAYLLNGKALYGVNEPAVSYSPNLPTYLRITDIDDDGRFIAVGKVSVDLDANSDCYLSEGDIVLARTGASVGKSYRYRKEDGPLVFAGFLIRIRLNTKKIVPAFLSSFLTTSQYWNWVRATSARSGQPGINGSEYSAMPVPIPPPSTEGDELAEQQRIADCVSTLDAQITAISEKLKVLQTHKKGLTQQLFPQQDAY